MQASFVLALFFCPTSMLRPIVGRPAKSFMRHAVKISSAFALLAALPLGGCGGGGGADAPSAPVIDVPRAWSAPTAGPIAFQSGNLTAIPDSCGGITLFGVHENVWKRQRYAPTTGWEAVAQPLAGPGLTASDEVQVLDTLAVPTVFFKYEGYWHQIAYRCERDEWWGSNPLPVQFFTDSAPLATATPIPIHFSRTFDDQILATSVLPDHSAITLQQVSANIWDQSVVYDMRTAPLDPGSGTTNPLLTTITKASAARAADGDAATVETVPGKFVAFRSSQNTSFARLSEPDFCLGHGCQLFTRSFAPPKVEVDGKATVLQNGSLADGQPSWFLFGPTGLRLIVALPSLYRSPESAMRALRPDGVAVWLASDQYQGALQIVENGVTAAWTGTSEGEAVAFGNASLNMFSAPDGNALATLRLGYQTTSLQPRLSISRRTGPAAWARDFTVDLSALFARYSNPYPPTASLVAFRESTRHTWVVGALAIGDTTGGITYRPFILWR